MSTDLASLGLAVDTSQVDAATKSLGNFAQSGKSAQISADVLVASAVRLGISVEEVQKRLDAANDNLATNTDMAIKLSEATKQMTASNDNFSRSMQQSNAETREAGKGFFKILENVLTLAGHLKLLAVGAYALSPAFRGVVNAGIAKVFTDIIPASALASQAITALGASLSTLFSFLARISPPILAAAAAFQIINSIWDKGAALLEKYGNSLRSLYSDDVVQNLTKLTKNQGDPLEVISAEQIARATELGIRLQDASFIIDRFFKTSVLNLTDVSLRLQSVWVVLVEAIARGAQIISSLPIEKLATAAVKMTPGLGIATTVAGVVSKATSSTPAEDPSLRSATDRLSALMGVANLAKESTDKLKASAGELGAELNIGGTFVARYSDAIKKLAEGGDKFNDTWDRVVKGIERQNAAMTANAATVGKDIEFQQQLRVETQLLTATKGGLNAATDEQIDKFVEYRSEMSTLDALTKSGIKLNEEYAKTFIELSKASGEAKKELAQASFTIANDRAMESDKISLRSLTAYSAAQKGAVAEAQKRLELQDDLNKKIATQEQVDGRAASARQLAIATEIKQLAEAARVRKLSADQTAASTQVAIDAAGKSVGENYRLTAIEQTRQQLEQDASARRAKFNQEEFDGLSKRISKTAELKQLEAQSYAQRNADFELQTAFMSSTDQQIASMQKSLHGDGWKSFMDDGLAATMRLSASFRSFSNTIENNLTSSIMDFANGTKTATEAAKNLGLTVVKALEEMLVKALVVKPIMDSLNNSIGGGGILSFLGIGGGSSLNANGSIAGAIGPTSIGGAPLVGLHSGGIVGSESTFTRFADLSNWDNAPKFHGGGIAGDEVPIIAKRGEGVFTEGQMAKMGGSGGVNVTYAPTYNLTGTAEEIEKIKAAAAEDRAKFSTNVISTIKRAQAGRNL